MSVLRPFGIVAIISGLALVLSAFAVSAGGGAVYAQDGETETPTNGTPAQGDETPTPADGDGTPTPTDDDDGFDDGDETPFPADETPVATPEGDVEGAQEFPTTGTGATAGGTDASLLFALGAAALVLGAGAVLAGVRQRS